MAIRTALVGYGEHASVNIFPNLLLDRRCDVVAVCDSDPGALDRAKSLCPAVRTYDDVEGLLRVEKIDAVIVVAPPQVHYAVAKGALSRGIHVFVEKPPAVTTAELRTLLDLARKNRLVTAVGQNLRHSLAWKQVQRVAEDCRLGRPLFVGINYSASGPHGERWGLSTVRSFLLSHVIHVADLAVNVSPQAKVCCARYVESSDRRSALAAVILGGDSTLINVTANTSSASFNIRASLTYPSGAEIRLDGLRHVEWHGGSGTKRIFSVWRPKTLDVGFATAGYGSEISDFFEAIGTRTHASPDFAEAICTYDMLDSIEALAQIA